MGKPIPALSAPQDSDQQKNFYEYLITSDNTTTEDLKILPNILEIPDETWKQVFEEALNRKGGKPIFKQDMEKIEVFYFNPTEFKTSGWSSIKMVGGGQRRSFKVPSSSLINDLDVLRHCVSLKIITVK